MSTENQSDDTGRKPTTKKLTRLKPKKTGPLETVSERVPDWLRALLGKYSESEGRLIGLQAGDDSYVEELGPLPEPGDIPASEPDGEESAQLSALLEQMAEDEPPEGERSATSVEWGAAPAVEEPAPIDDLLTTMAAGEGDDVQIEADTPPVDSLLDEDATVVLSAADLEAEVLPPPAPAEDHEVPDWLTSALDEGATGAETDMPPPAAPDPEADVPDWLTSIVDDTDVAAADSGQPPAASPQAASTGEIPDWLSSALDEETTAASAQAGPDQSATPPSEAAASSLADDSAASEPGEVVEIPDWLDSVTPDDSLQDDVDQAETALPADPQAQDAAVDVPDWLSEMAPATADEPESALITDAEPSTEAAPAADSGVTAADEDVDLPSWDVPDWIAEAGPPEVAADPSQVQGDEVPDWLGVAETESSAAGPAEPAVGADDTLTELPPETAASEAQPAEFDPAPTSTDEDWLAEPDLPPDAVSPEAAAGALTGDQPADSEPAPTSTDEDWLAELDLPPDAVSPEAAAGALTGDQPADSEPAPTSTDEDWLAELDLPPDAVSPEAAAGALTGDQPAEPEIDTAVSETPAPVEQGADDWLNQLDSLRSEAEAPPAPESPEATADDDWLATLDAPPGAEPQPEAPVEAESAGQPEQEPDAAGVEPVEQPVEPGEIDTVPASPAAEPAEVEPDAQVVPGPPAEPDDEDQTIVLRPLTEAGPEPAAESDAAADDADVMEELFSLTTQEGDEPDEWPADEPALAEGLVMPDWLFEGSGAQAETETAAPADEVAPIEAPAAAELPAGEAPDETAEPGAETEPADDAAPSLETLAAEAEPDTPGWLAGIIEDGDQVAEVPIEPEGEPASPDQLPPAPEVVGATIASEEIGQTEAKSEIPDQAVQPETETENILAEMPAAELEPETPEPVVDLPATSPEAPPAGHEDEATQVDEVPALSDVLETALPPVAAEIADTDAELEMPDWLDLPEPGETAGVEAAAAAAEADQDIPAWLTGLTDSDETEAATGQGGPEPAEDWLVEFPEAGEAFSTASLSEDDTDLDLPDWINEVSPGPAGSADEAGDTSDLEMPEWLDLPGADDPVDSGEQAADWLTGLPDISAAAEVPTGELESDAPDQPVAGAVEPEDAAEPALPAWLSDLPDTSQEPPDIADEAAGSVPETVAPDQPLEAAEVVEPAPAPEVPETDAEPEMPGWLADLPDTAEPIDEPAAPDADADVDTPDWLQDLSEPAQADEPVAGAVEPEDAAEPALPAWLSDLPDTSQEPPDIADEAAGSVPETVAPDQPLEAAEVVEPAPAPEVPETDAEPEMPGWLADLPDTAEPIDEPAAPDADADVDTPDWLQDLSEPAQADEPVAGAVEPEDAAEPALPAWLSDLPDTSQEPPDIADEAAGSVPETVAPDQPLEAAEVVEPAPAPEVPETDAEPEMPGWLADLPDTAKPIDEPAAPDADADVDTPDWLQDLPQPAQADEPAAAAVEPEDAAEPALPAWPSDLPDTSQEPPDIAAEPAERDREAPAWMADALETEDVAQPMEEQVEELVSPDWLKDLALSAEEFSVSEPAETEPEPATPDWLSEVPEAPDTGSLEIPAAVAADQESELEMPDWLSEVPEAPDTGILSQPLESTAEPEMPDWLSEVPEAPDTGSLLGLADQTDAIEDEAETETPDWLTQVVEDSEATEPSAEPVAVEDDIETPQWLADLSLGRETAASPEEAEPALELDLPASLDMSPEPIEEVPDAEEAAEAETGSEAEDWLAELPARDADKTTPAEPSLATEAQEDLEIPDWLATSPEPEVATETEADPSEGEATLEIPDWLASAPPEMVAEILAELEGLSDEEVQQLLDEEAQGQDD